METIHPRQQLLFNLFEIFTLDKSLLSFSTVLIRYLGHSLEKRLVKNKETFTLFKEFTHYFQM